MGKLLAAFGRGLRLRCPSCGQGGLFSSMFKMRSSCPRCGFAYERTSGEITGGMGFNIMVTLLIFIVGFIVMVLLGASYRLQLAVWLPFMLIFPILFYPFSRALWVVVLYLTSEPGS